MTKNRTILFGYIKEMGKAKACDYESKIVREIYVQYAGGKSYKAIADILTEKEVSYTADKKVWNKNMVSRILQNETYLGTEEYPSIISVEMKSSSDKALKPYNKTLSEFLKISKKYFICEKCGSKVIREKKSGRPERWYCENSNNHISPDLTDEKIEKQMIEFIESYIKDYNFIQKLSNTSTEEVMKRRQEIDTLLSVKEIDVKDIQQKIQRLAELKYMTLEDTIHFKQNTLEQLVNDPIKNIDKLKEIVKYIILENKGISNAVMIDQNIER